MKKNVLLGSFVCLGMLMNGVVVSAAEINKENLGYANMQVTQGADNEDSRGTVVGSVGKSWIYTNRVTTLKSQSSVGIESKYTMASLTWNVSYSDGKYSGTNLEFPWSKDWEGTTSMKHSQSGYVTTAFTATAVTTNGMVIASLVPVSGVHLY